MVKREHKPKRLSREYTYAQCSSLLRLPASASCLPTPRHVEREHLRGAPAALRFFSLVDATRCAILLPGNAAAHCTALRGGRASVGGRQSARPASLTPHTYLRGVRNILRDLPLPLCLRVCSVLRACELAVTCVCARGVFTTSLLQAKLLCATALASRAVYKLRIGSSCFVSVPAGTIRAVSACNGILCTSSTFMPP